VALWCDEGRWCGGDGYAGTGGGVTEEEVEADVDGITDAVPAGEMITKTDADASACGGGALPLPPA